MSIHSLFTSHFNLTYRSILNIVTVSCKEKIICCGRYIRNKNSYKNGKRFKKICSFIVNYTKMDLQVWTTKNDYSGLMLVDQFQNRLWHQFFKMPKRFFDRLRKKRSTITSGNYCNFLDSLDKRICEKIPGLAKKKRFFIKIMLPYFDDDYIDWIEVQIS